MGQVYSKWFELIGDPSWQHMPWKHWKDPLGQFKVLPTFAVIEWTYRIAAWTCFLHARKTGGLPLWFSGFLCGTANDIFFMFLPFCDNFWQGQASVMITPRLPLYIVEMYMTILYLSSVGARQFNLPYLSEAALTGLMAHVLYGVYDINGPPFLWWTWHDGDPSISARQQNAPLGSSMWILTYISLHQLLLRFCEFPESNANVHRVLTEALKAVLEKLPAKAQGLAKTFKAFEILDKLKPLQLFLNQSSWATRIAWSGLVCTPMFMSLMGVFQIFSLDTVGIPGKRTYRLTLAVYIALVIRGFRHAHKSGALYLPKLRTTHKWNFRLLLITLGFYAVNFGICLKGDPEKHISTGCHQTYNKKSKVVRDVMGFKREDHISENGPKEFSRHDYQLPSKEEHGTIGPDGTKIIRPTSQEPDSEWYTVKGKPRLDKAGDLKLLSIFSLIGCTVYSLAFTNKFSLPSYTG